MGGVAGRALARVGGRGPHMWRLGRELIVVRDGTEWGDGTRLFHSNVFACWTVGCLKVAGRGNAATWLRCGAVRAEL